MRWTLPKKKLSPMLVFHIGSASVSGAIFIREGAGIPTILASHTERIVLEADFEPKEFFTKTMRALGTVAGNLYKTRLAAPRKIYCVLASPWYASQTRHLKFRKEEPFVFTEKIADELIAKETKLFTEEHLAKYAGTSNALTPIELKNIRTLLNGYNTPEPLYKKCKEIDMTLFISMSGDSTLREIEKVIFRHFHFDQIKFSSFAISSFTVARDLDPKRENFLLVDVGGEVTDMFVVKRHVLGESASFPLGRNFLVRGISEAFQTSTHEAASLLSLYKDGHASEEAKRKLEPVLDKLKGEWLQKFQMSLAGISEDISIPGLIYLTTEGTEADIFAPLIQSEQWSQYILAESKFEIVPLDMKILHSLTNFPIEDKSEPALAIDSVYISRFLATI